MERVSRDYRVRVDDRISADIFLPIDAQGERQQGAISAVLQGGLVEASRYEWLAIHLASRGHVVVLSEHIGQLTFFEEGNTMAVIELIRADEEFAPLISSERGSVFGHSLGGTTAATLWFRRPEVFSSLFLLASEPKQWHDFTTRGVVVDAKQDLAVTIESSEDGRLSSDRALSGLDALEETAGASAIGLSIQGMIHMHWATEATAEELENDGTPGITEDEARRRALIMIDLAFDGGADAINSPSEAWPEGVLPLRDSVEGTP